MHCGAFRAEYLILALTYTHGKYTLTGLDGHTPWDTVLINKAGWNLANNMAPWRLVQRATIRLTFVREGCYEFIGIAIQLKSNKDQLSQRFFSGSGARRIIAVPLCYKTSWSLPDIVFTHTRLFLQYTKWAAANICIVCPFDGITPTWEQSPATGASFSP